MRTESGLWLKNDAVLVQLEVRLLDVFLQCEGHPIEASKLRATRAWPVLSADGCYRR